MTPEERTHACKRLARGVEAYFDADDEEFVGNLTRDMEAVARQAQREALERAESIAAEHAEFCAKEAHNGGSSDLYERASGAAFIRDKIRALKDQES